MLRISPYSHGGVDQIIEDMQGWAWEFVHHKVIGFEDLHPSGTEQKAIMRALYNRFNVRCTECNEAPPPSHITQLGIHDQGFFHGEIGEVEERNWHMDDATFEKTTAILSLHMTHFAYPPGPVGNTVFCDMERLFQQAPEETQRYALETRMHHVEPEGGSDGEQERDHALQGAIHDGVRIHPETKQTSFYVPNFWFEPEEESTPEFVEYIEYIKEQVYDPVNQERWIWNEGDMVIWDNRNLMHTMSGGWNAGERIFNRCSIGTEKPIGVSENLVLFE